MTRRSPALLVVVTVAVTLLAPAPAGATTTPSPTPPPASVSTPLDLSGTPDPAAGEDPEDAADPAATPAPLPQDPPQPPAPAPPQDTPHAVAGVLEDIAEQGTRTPDLLGTLLEEDDAGPPWAHYDLGASVGAITSLFSHQARLTFSAGVWFVAVADWLLGFVLRFDVGRLLAGDAGVLAGRYAQMLDGPGGIPLRQLMLLLAVAHAGWQVMRHRAAAAVPELLVAVSIAATGAYLLHDVDTAACRGLGAMAGLTTGTIALADPGPGADVPPLAVTDPCAGAGAPVDAGFVRDSMVQTFLHEPFLLLQWGVVPPEGTACRQVADALVAARPWRDDDQPRRFMTDAGCEDMADFNAEISTDRVMGSVAYAVATAAFAVAMVLTAGTLLVAQVAGALLVMVMPFALVVGISPGAGRELLARWGHSLLKVAVLFLGSGFFLAVLASSVSAIQQGTQGRSVLVRMLSSVIVAWALVLLRGKVFANLRRAARSTSARVAGPGTDVGATGSGPGASAARGVYAAADVALTMHGGAQAVRALAGPGGGGGGPGGGPTTAMVAGRGRSLGRHHQALAAPAPGPLAAPTPGAGGTRP